jgi:hypothetical protein
MPPDPAKDCLLTSIQIVPENAPEAISGSLKYKNFLRENVPDLPRNRVLMHTDKWPSPPREIF